METTKAQIAMTKEVPTMVELSATESHVATMAERVVAVEMTTAHAEAAA